MRGKSVADSKGSVACMLDEVVTVDDFLFATAQSLVTGRTGIMSRATVDLAALDQTRLASRTIAIEAVGRLPFICLKRRWMVTRSEDAGRLQERGPGPLEHQPLDALL